MPDKTKPDLIDRAEALAVIRHLKSPARSPAQNELIRRAEIGINRIPDAAPVVHGRWGKMYKSKMTVTVGYISSCCDMWSERRYNFCPYCGARMDGTEKNT